MIDYTDTGHASDHITIPLRCGWPSEFSTQSSAWTLNCLNIRKLCLICNNMLETIQKYSRDAINYTKKDLHTKYVCLIYLSKFFEALGDSRCCSRVSTVLFFWNAFMAVRKIFIARTFFLKFCNQYLALKTKIRTKDYKHLFT